jgi:transketolase
VVQSARESYGKTLVNLGEEYPDIVVLGGDLNKSTVVNLFAQKFPNRFFDFGPAEQNIVSAAVGFASCGKIPFVSTFAVFGTGRAYDQLRVGVAQGGLNVKLVLTHAGITVGEDGMSAQAIEDIALITAMPGFTVVVPADSIETEWAVREAVSIDGPVYIRLSRGATPLVHSGIEDTFRIGKAELMRDGNDATIIACGIMVSIAQQAAALLSNEGVETRIINMHTLAPIDSNAIVSAAKETGVIITAEEHFVRGGLNSIVSQELSARYPTPVERVALDSYGESGNPDQLIEKYGLGAGKIVEAVRRGLARKISGD